MPEIKANVRTSPGIITQRGCTYAGCKGVVLGPTRDISTSPTARSAAASIRGSRAATRRSRPPLDDENFIPYCFSTDMQEEDIVFGGEKQLRQAIQEAYRHLPPQGDRRLLDLPGGPDRRRRARRGPRDEGEARHQRLRLQLRGLPRREPVGRAPHRQQRPVQARHRPGRHAARGQVQRDHARRVQHRRRRLRARRPASSAAASTWWPPSAATRPWPSSRTPTWPT